MLILQASAEEADSAAGLADVPPGFSSCSSGRASSSLLAWLPACSACIHLSTLYNYIYIYLFIFQRLAGQEGGAPFSKETETPLRLF